MRRAGAVTLLVAAALAATSTAAAFETLGRPWRDGRATFRIEPNFPDQSLSGSPEQQIEVLRAASSAWRDQSRADFQFLYGGTTSSGGVNLNDGVNTVSWVNDDGGDALAATFIRFSSGGRVSGFDMVFYATTGGVANRWNGPRDPARTSLDLSGVAVHEFGHALGLDHTTVQGATMYPSIAGSGLTMRTLALDDLAGVEYLYGSARAGADPSPALLLVDPAMGPSEGGTEVVLHGRNFTWTADTTLRISGVPLSRSLWDVESMGLLRIQTMPPMDGGPAAITIDNTLGVTEVPAAYTYESPGPSLAGIEPSLGPLDGGIEVTIQGTNFSDEVMVTVGGEPILEQRVIDSNTIVGVLPAAITPGVADIEVIAGADSSRLPEAFTYTAMVLTIENAGLPAGGRSESVGVLASTDRDLAGISFGVTYDPAVLGIPDVAVAGTLTQDAEFASANADVAGGVTTFGAVLDLTGSNRVLAAGEDLLVARLLVDVDPAASPGVESALHLAGGVGDPPIDLFFTPVGTAERVVPFTEDGIVTVTEGPSFIRGDTTGDGALDLSDAVGTLDYLFRGEAQPPCPDAADANDDAVIDVSDAVYTLLYLFGGGEPPPAPFPDPGPDPTPDVLGCGGL